jgi:hypothetical protein
MAVWLLVLVFQVIALQGIGSALSGGTVGFGHLGSALLQGPMIFLTWILLPLSLYYDTKYVKLNSGWEVPRGLFVGIALLAPFINGMVIAFGVVMVGTGVLFGMITPLFVLSFLGYYVKKRRAEI